ncbi:MAG TPA: PDR/VanB family oxidoreductase [Burkholderiaceae bacterium]
MRNPDQWHPATVRAHRDLTPTVREFELRPEGGVRPWTVGSHLNLRVPIHGRDETRSYSLVGLPGRPGADAVYRIAVKRAAPSRGGSSHLWSLETGAELLVGEPNNHFELPLNAPQYLLVAGGIGITPIVGMAQLLSARGADVRLLYAARSAAEFALRDELCTALGERLRTFADDADERIAFAEAIAALRPAALLLMCGPLPMLNAVRAAWADSGRPAANLRFETFGNSGASANEAFWVRLPRHGLELQVPADRTLLEVLNDAGVDTLFDCRRGECGLCAVDVVEAHGRIDHRDVFFSAPEKQAGTRLCACVSRVSGGGLVLDSAYRPD